MALKEERDKAANAARAIVDGAKAAVRDLTADEIKSINEHLDAVRDLDGKIADATSRKAMLDAVAGLSHGEASSSTPDADEDGTKGARDLGEFLVKSDLGRQLKAGLFSDGGRHTAGTPEFKAPTPTATTGITVPPQFGDVKQTLYRRLTINDLLAQGTLSSNALTYWTQGALTGDVGTVAEGGAKANINFAFGQTTEVLTKLAAVAKVTDEMTQDLDFLVSVIKSQMLQRLAIVEEDQLLNGNGTTPNLRGLMNRTGIQTYATSATASAKKWMDGIFHAMTLVRVNSFIEPDGIIINPLDYETLRLGADTAGQYYGGGPFTNAYGPSADGGGGAFSLMPGLWTLPTVVTPAMAQGSVLVGGFGQSSQVFRKGGVRLESTNSNEDDFKNNLVAFRVEERLALACYYSQALCKVTLTP